MIVPAPTPCASRAPAHRSCLTLLALALACLFAPGCGAPEVDVPAAPPAARTDLDTPDDATPAQIDAARRALTTYAGFPTREFVFARDAYPVADTPPTVRALDAPWLPDESEVFGVVVGNEARAYPIRILAFHHVVNDVLGGQPVAVTYCIVCSSAVAYDPRVDGEVLTFGLDGAWRGVATLYDRTSRSIWLHLTGACIEGRHAGRTLERLGSGRHTTWADWRRLHPDTTVVAPLPAIVRAAPGRGYPTEAQARSGGAGWPAVMQRTLPPPDARLRANELLYGVQAQGEARAYPLATLARRPVVHESVGGESLVVFFDARSRSAAAFVPRVGDRALTFRWAADAGFRDDETDSTWTMDGTCASGPLAGTALQPGNGRLTEWYGWVAHHPQTTIWAPKLATALPLRN